jgi:hypothetical protein
MHSILEDVGLASDCGEGVRRRRKLTSKVLEKGVAVSRLPACGEVLTLWLACLLQIKHRVGDMKISRSPFLRSCFL